MADWQIERLDESHAREEFCCGKPPLDDFLRHYAGQYERRGVGRTYVAVRAGDKRVFGFYTLCAGAVRIEHLPKKAAKKLPKHPVPVIHLGRLAVDQAVRGQRLGSYLLMHALKRCLELSGPLGVHAVEVVAIDPEAKEFYLRFGFAPLADSELHLYYPIKTIEEELGPAGQG
jgi:GNAT superfamily N-acetyltransferase